MSYDYAARKAILDDPASGELSPHVYVLCNRCAEKLRPPNGWELDDLRERPPLFLDQQDQIAVGVGASAEPEHEGAPDPVRRQLFFGYSA